MRYWWCLLAALAVASVARAAPPLEVYGRLPAIDFVALSPSGERFALAARDGERRKLFVRRADGEAEAVTGLPAGKVRDLVWGGDRHLFIFGSSTIYAPIAGFDRQEWMGGAHLDLKTGKAFGIFDKSNTFIQAFFGWYGVRQIDGHDYAFVGGYTFDQLQPRYNPSDEYANLVRIDLETGASKLVATAAGGNSHWLLGPAGEIIVRGATDPHGSAYQLFRGGGGQPILVSKASEGVTRMRLEGFGRTSDSLLLLERSNDDVLLREVPLSNMSGGQVLKQGDNTVGGVFDRDTHLLLGISSHEGGEIAMFDPLLQKKVDAARKAFPGLRTALVSYGHGFDRMVFLTSGPGDSGTYWLVDIAKRSAIPIGRVNPEIKEADVGPSRMVSYKAADGLDMDGVLTLPPGGAGGKLPLVVIPHGGPLVAGDQVGFDWWAQAFASRGYAVFQPNYRGTLGRGEAFRKAAYGEFGRKMQTDVSDGVKALAAQGIIDPGRVCIVGASYGGYAALAGVTVEQGIYRCAVSVAGLSDLSRFQIWIATRSGSDLQASNFWRALMGAAGSQDLKAVSPAQLARRADAPILLIHGEDDSVVPMEQSRAMEKALQAAGKPVEFVSMPGEDHWLSKEATREIMLARAVAFVEKHNPAR